MPLRVHPGAAREFEEALQWCTAEFGPETAARLRRRIDQAGQALMLDPGLGTPTKAGARQLPLGRFPYSLVYRVDGPVIHVLALMHQRRMPDYWAGRR